MAPSKTFTQEDVEQAVKDALAKNAAKTGAFSKEDLASVLKETIPAVIMAMEQARTMTTHEMTLKALKSKQALEEKCHICGQAVGDGKGRGCGGPWAREANGDFKLDKNNQRVEDANQFHIQMAVFPTDPIAVDQWDGVTINSRRYASQGLNHKIWVPKVNDIPSMILKFEEDQRIQQVGRKKIRHNGGTVSGKTGAAVQPPSYV